MKRRDFMGIAATLALTRRLPALDSPAPAGFSGRWLRPEDSAYEEARHVFNGRLRGRPRVLAQIARVEDIPLALEWARAQGFTVAVRGSGHSYEGYSLGKDMVLDTRALSEIELLAEDQIRVGSGVLFQSLLGRLENRDLAFPTGSCPTVGVAGYALGGGLSILSRHLGMGTDRVCEIEMIDPQGKTLVASASQNPELFWGLRGGGAGNFGVITRLTLQTLPLKQVVLFRRNFAWERLREIVERWQAWAYSADSRIGSHLSVRGGAQKHVTMTGVFAGTGGESQALQPAFGEPLEQFDKGCSFVEAMRLLGGKPGRGTSAFWGTSDFLTKPLSSGLVGELARSLDTAPVTLLLDSLGGAIDAPSADATAYVHRSGNQFCLQALAYETKDFDGDAAQRWLARYREIIKSEVSGFAYQNYPDKVRSRWDSAYYGEALPRLRALRKMYDPNGLLDQP